MQMSELSGRKEEEERRKACIELHIVEIDECVRCRLETLVLHLLRYISSTRLVLYMKLSSDIDTSCAHESYNLHVRGKLKKNYVI